MKKTIKMFVFVALFSIKSIISFGQSNGTSINCSEIPANTVPHMAINDFAGMIDVNQKSGLESRLRSYWDTASIAICVVTIPSLGNYDQFDYSLALFNCWGVGGKDDRGVLVFIALKEHAITIRPGYGMEECITDAKCNQISSKMKPLFRQEKYSEGIIGCVNDLIATMGTISWEDRQRAIKYKKEIEAREEAENTELVMNVLFSIAFFALIGFIIYLIGKSIVKSREKKEANIYIDKLKAEIAKANKLLQDSLGSFSKEAAWAKSEAEDHMMMCKKSVDQATILVNKCSTAVDVNIDATMEIAHEAAMLLEKAFKSFTKMNSDLKIKVRKIESEAPARLKLAQETVAANSAILMDFIYAGFDFKEAQSHQQSFEKKLADYDADINNKERLSEIYTDSLVVKEKSEKLITQLTEIIHQKDMIDSRLLQLGQDIKDIRQHYFETDKSLNILKKNYPEKVWINFEAKLNSDMSKLSFDNVEATRKKINLLNSMKEQKFSEAQSKFESLASLVAETVKNFNQIVNTVHEQDNARKEYPITYNSTEVKIASVLKESKDTDVSSGTKSLAKGLSQKLSGVKISSEKTLVDWIGLVKLLRSIQNEAETVLSKINSEISDASKARSLAAERARERNSYHSNRNDRDDYAPSISTYSSGSNSDISSFGGFGGGETGGGGIDTNW